MTDPNRFPRNPDLSLPVVDTQTIEQVEHSGLGADELYDGRFEQNPELALWVRRRAIGLEPDDMEKREAVASFALEALQAADHQLAINGLIRNLDEGMPNGTETQQAETVSEADLPPAA